VYFPKSVDANGRDIVDAAIEIRAGQTLPRIQFVLSNRPTRVAGRLTDAKGNATADGTLLLFAADPPRWGEDSRYIATVRPDQQGMFEHVGLPPGDYLAAAVDYVAGGKRTTPRSSRS